MLKRGGKDYVNFPALNAFESLGNRWQKISRDGIHDRMKMWGLNTLAAWSSTEIRQDRKTPYTLLASIWWLTGKKTPSPFRDDYVEDLCKALENSKWAKNDPYCLGIFIGNEFEWPDRFSQLVFELPDDDTTKQWVQSQLRKKYSTLDRLNQAWGTSFSSWNQVPFNVVTQNIMHLRQKTLTPSILNLPRSSSGNPNRRLKSRFLAHSFLAADVTADQMFSAVQLWDTQTCSQSMYTTMKFAHGKSLTTLTYQ